MLDSGPRVRELYTGDRGNLRPTKEGDLAAAFLGAKERDYAALALRHYHLYR